MALTSAEDTVGGIMTKTPVTVKPEITVKNALRIMIKRDIGSLIVVKSGKPVGIITERDVTRGSLRPAKAKRVYDTPVARLMSRPLVTVPPTTPIWQAFDTMLTKKIRRLPVVEQGRLVGLVTERDLVKWVIRVFYEPNIPDRIKKFLE